MRKALSVLLCGLTLIGLEAFAEENFSLSHEEMKSFIKIEVVMPKLDAMVGKCARGSYRYYSKRQVKRSPDLAAKNFCQKRGYHAQSKKEDESA